MKKFTLFLVAMTMSLFSFAQTPQMIGTYTVGTGGTYDYASMADAGMAIKAAEFTGDVTLLICTDLTETINTGIVNKSEYTLTIRPDKDENRTITYTTATDNTGPTGVFVIGGDMTKTPGSTIGWASVPTKNVVVDGAAEGKTTPRLKITTGKWGTSFLLYGDVQDCVVKNCILENTAAATANYALTFRSENYSKTSKNIGPKNCLVENCVLEATHTTKSQTVYFQGNQANSVAGYPANITIRNCNIKAHTRGMFLYGVNGLNVEGCTFDLSDMASGLMCHGILGNTVKGTINVKGNKFIKNSTKNTYAGEYGLQTITASGGATVWVIENNYFAGYNAVASGTTTKESRLVGIRCGDPCEIRHNTFYMPKLTYAPATPLVSTHAVALLWLAGSHQYPVQNNIFVCEETTANVSLIRGGLNENVTGNVFYHKGGNAAIVAAAPSCVAFADLETSYPTQAATSKWKNVTFTDAANGDLSLAGLSDGDFDLAVDRLADVLTDIEGKTRGEKTHAGAYEGTFREPLPSSISLNAYPVQDYSASIVGTMKRAIQNGENTIVLTHEADGTPHIYNIAHATKTVTELSQEGVIARDTENLGDYLSISDIALTEDGKLIASNYMRCEQGTTPATGYKVGEIRYYIWSDINGAPTRWFTTNRTANSTYADVSYTFAIKGTSTNAQVMSTAVHNSNRAARINLHTVVGGVETAYHRFGIHTTASEYTEAKQGLKFQLTATPLKNIWTLEGELTDATSFAVPAATGAEYNGTALNGTNLGQKYNGVSYLPNYNDHHLMVAPYADGSGKLAGVKVLGITYGFDNAIAIATNTNLLNTIDATAAAATAYVDGDGDLTIYLIADAKVYAFSQKAPIADFYTVTATAGEGGSVEGSGTYEANTIVTLTATPAEHYTFKNWTVAGSEVSTTATYSFEVTTDVEVTANFKEDDKFTINAHADHTSKGYVTGGGTDIYVGTELVLKATAKTGYYFTQWHDGNTENPRTISVTEAAEYIAEFANAYPRVYAYDLNVVDNGDDTYTFSFKPNTDAVSGNLLLYSEDGASVVQTHAIGTPIAAHTATTITLNKTDLPDQSEVPWAIELSGNAIPTFAEAFADSDLRYARAHAVVDNSPESEYFGRIYVADRRKTKSNSKVYVYNPDFTDFTNTNLGLATAGYSRPAVGTDGTLYLTGYTDGEEAGIFVVNPADLTKCTQFFNGTYDANGLYKNNGKEIGSSTSGVGVYGAGKDAVLYTMMEDGSNANFNSGKQPIVCYQIGQDNGTVLKQWSDEPTWLVNYPATGKDSYNFGNNDFAATAKGVWVSQNKSNIDDRPEIAFVDKTGTIQFMQNSNKCLGGGMTVNADNTVLYIVEDSKILEYAIAWNENTPSLTLSKSYPISLANVSTLSMDYAGNLIACAGTSYSTTDDNKMKVVCFTLPTDNNHSIVPAAKTKAIKLGARYMVTVVVNDESMGEVIGAGSYKEGEIVELAAAPVANHRIVDWKKGEDVLSTSLTCSFEVTEDVTINVTFEKIPQYTVTTVASPDGKGTIIGGGTYNEGTEVELKATAHTGYTFVKWDEDGNTEATRTITVTGPVTYTAIFDKVAPRAWAYDLRQVENGENYEFTFTATSAGTATLIFKDKDGNTLDFGAHTATATTAEEKTIKIAKSTFEDATKDIYWEVKMEGAAIENMVEVTDPAAGIYNFYVPQGIAVDNNTNSDYFGQIYVAQATNGASDGGSEMAKNQTVGLFVYDQKLTLKNTNYEGIAPQNVAFNTGNPIGSIDAIRQQMHRIAVDPITSEVAFAYYKSDATPATAIYAMNPTELLGNATNLINGASITKANSLCYDEKGALYVMDNANTGTVGGQIYKVQNGEVTLFAAHDKNNQWAVYDNAMASDGRGGIWIAQNRYGYDYPILSHVNKDGVVDFAVKENQNGWFPNNNTGSSYRGQLAYNLNENILAFAGNKMVTLFTVEYDGDGKPTINKLMSTPLLGGGYIDGVAFDYAGDLYVASASAERLYKFVVPTNTNTCTVPAPESQVIEKEQKYTVTVVASPAEGGSVSGGGEAAAGAQVTVSATANTGYRFVNWTKGGDEESTDASFSYTVPAGDVTLIANFEKISYTLTVFVNDETKGTIDVTTGSYEYGSEVTLTATPNPGYKLLAWSNKAKTSSITITMDNNKAVSAYFVKDYDVEPTISVTQVWKNTDVPATTMNGFQAVGWGGKIYLKDRLNRTIWEYSSESVKEVYTLTDDFTSESALKGDQPIAVDNAGNLIVRSGSGEFHTSPVQVTIYRNGEKTGKTVDFTLPVTERCDFITASGDIFSEKGGYIYFLCKDQKTVSRLFIKNGAITAEDVAVDAVATIPTAASSQSNVVLDIYGNIHTQSKNAGAYEYNITTLAATADPYLGAATKKNPNSTIGGCTFELGGKELWAYAAGTTNYSSEWELSDANGGLVSDGVLCINDLTTVKNNTAANWLNVQVVDENTAYIYQFCPTVGVAVWKVSIETEVNVTIDENADNTTTLTPYKGEVVNATVNRNFGANKILTVTLPFDMSASQISNHFGNATVYEFYNVVDAGEELHLQFSRTTSIEAGKPYIIQTAASGYDAEDGFTIEDVTINTEPTHVKRGDITMVPVLDGGGTLNQPTQYYLSNNALYCAGDYERPLPGLRAFFTSATSTPIRARVIFDDNGATSIPTVIAPETKSQKIIKDGRLIIIRGEHQYNAQGQMIE